MTFCTKKKFNRQQFVTVYSELMRINKSNMQKSNNMFHQIHLVSTTTLPGIFFLGGVKILMGMYIPTREGWIVP